LVNISASHRPCTAPQTTVFSFASGTSEIPLASAHSSFGFLSRSLRPTPAGAGLRTVVAGSPRCGLRGFAKMLTKADFEEKKGSTTVVAILVICSCLRYDYLTPKRGGAHSLKIQIEIERVIMVV